MFDSIFTWLTHYGILGVAVGLAVGWPIFGAVLVLAGRLYTAPQVTRDRDRDKETIDRQEATIIRQETAVAKKDEAIETFSKSFEELLELGRATNHFVQEVLTAARQAQGKPDDPA